MLIEFIIAKINLFSRDPKAEIYVKVLIYQGRYVNKCSSAVNLSILMSMHKNKQALGAHTQRISAQRTSGDRESKRHRVADTCNAYNDVIR